MATSEGGLKALAVILSGLPADFPAAIAIVMHLSPEHKSILAEIIKDEGGTVIAQDRPTSENFSMPETSIKTGDVDFILPLDEIAPKLIELVGAGNKLRGVCLSAKSRRRPIVPENVRTPLYPVRTKAVTI